MRLLLLLLLSSSLLLLSFRLTFCFLSFYPSFFLSVCLFFLFISFLCFAFCYVLVLVFVPYELHMDLCKESYSSVRPDCRPVGRPVVLRGKTLTLVNTRIFFNQFVHAFYAYRHRWLLPFNTTFTYLDLGWESQGQCEPNTSWLHFLALFSTNVRIKFYLLLKLFKLNILITLLSGIEWNKGSNCCFTNCVKKKQKKL